MRLSQAYWQTYKEVPKDAEIPSHRLMMRAGFLHKVGSGIYHYLPFAIRTLQKIENIIREEMNRAGSMEVKMAVVTPAELWQESGRWDAARDVMLQFKDRGEKEMCISPTNEETVTDIFRKTVKSYKQLPVSLYQINTKFRDEIRPRFGLMRGREFVMKDAYTFHESKECLDEGYECLYKAYERIFERLGLDFIVVEADAGMMAGADCKTHEFQVVADTGEDLVIYSNEANYASNIEKAATIRKDLDFAPATELKEVETKGKATIKDVCDFLGTPQHHSLKSLVYKATKGDEDKHILVMLLGDDELNEIKLVNELGCDHLTMVNDATLEKLGLVKGYIGPHKVQNVEIIYDNAIDLKAGYCAGANKADYHFTGFVPERDSEGYKQADVRLSREDDYTPDGKHKISMKRGIEVGHIFQLGDKYTKSLDSSVLDKNGKQVFPQMGCYGIGVTRTMAAAIEQNHDENGIIWPKQIAPFHVYFAMIGKSDEIKNLGTEIYEDLLKKGIEVLFDDRGQGPGAMFKDADLLGLPIRLTLGERDYNKDGTFELALRKNGKSIRVKREEIIPHIKEYLGE